MPLRRIMVMVMSLAAPVIMVISRALMVVGAAALRARSARTISAVMLLLVLIARLLVMCVNQLQLVIPPVLTAMTLLVLPVTLVRVRVVL